MTAIGFPLRDVCDQALPLFYSSLYLYCCHHHLPWLRFNILHFPNKLSCSNSSQLTRLHLKTFTNHIKSTIADQTTSIQLVWHNKMKCSYCGWPQHKDDSCLWYMLLHESRCRSDLFNKSHCKVFKCHCAVQFHASQLEVVMSFLTRKNDCSKK